MERASVLAHAAWHLNTDGRDLALTTDFRSVLGEVLGIQLGSKNLQTVFQRFENSPAKFPRLLKA